jgi:hypothetical protein
VPESSAVAAAPQPGTSPAPGSSSPPTARLTHSSSRGRSSGHSTLSPHPGVLPVSPRRKPSVLLAPAPKNTSGRGAGRSYPHALLAAGQRKLTVLLALPAIVLLLPLFVLPFFGRRRYDA